MKGRSLRFAVLAVAVLLLTVAALVLLREEREQDSGESPHAAGLPTAGASGVTEPQAAPIGAPSQNARVPLEGKTLEPELTEGTLLQIAIAATDGIPIAEATVVLFREQELLDFGASNAQGVASFMARPGSGEIAVFAPGYPLLRQAIDFTAGKRQVTLPEGEVLDGRVDVDGSPPRESIALLWIADYQPRAAFDQLPSNVRERLRDLPAGDGCPVAATDAQGGFAFHGLARGAPGRLTWREPYWAVDESAGIDRQELKLPAPRRDLRLHLQEGVELRLRVVDSNAAPVPRAKVELITASKKPGDDPNPARVADGQGRCRFALPRNQKDRVLVIVALPDSGGTTGHSLRIPAITHGVWDAGDLAVQATRALSVRVEDSEGHPVEGALVTPQPSVTGRDRIPTDSDGRCTLSLAQDIRKISVIAKGYELGRAAVAPETRELVVVLESRSQLEFVITGFEGGPRDLTVIVFSDQPLYSDDPRPDGPARNRAQVSINAQGHGQIERLNPNIPLRAELHNRGGQVLAEASISPLSNGEHRRVEFAVTIKPLWLLVRVQNDQEQPVPNARVTLKYPLGGGDAGLPVDAAGQVKFGPIYSQPFILVASAPEFAPKILRGVTIPPEELTLVLEASRRVEVELRNLDGSPYLGKSEMWAGTGGGPDGICAPIGGGRWTVDGLPRGEISLFVEGDFDDLHELHDASNAKRVLVVGERGSVKVAVTSTGGHERQEWAVALADAGSAQARKRVPFHFDVAGRKEIVFKGLPMAGFDIWLETRGSDGAWSRIGASVSTTLDADRAQATLQLRH